MEVSLMKMAFLLVLVAFAIAESHYDKSVDEAHALLKDVDDLHKRVKEKAAHLGREQIEKGHHSEKKIDEAAHKAEREANEALKEKADQLSKRASDLLKMAEHARDEAKSTAREVAHSAVKAAGSVSKHVSGTADDIVKEGKDLADDVAKSASHAVSKLSDDKKSFTVVDFDVAMDKADDLDHMAKMTEKATRAVTAIKKEVESRGKRLAKEAKEALDKDTSVKQYDAAMEDVDHLQSIKELALDAVDALTEAQGVAEMHVEVLASSLPGMKKIPEIAQKFADSSQPEGGDKKKSAHDYKEAGMKAVAAVEDEAKKYMSDAQSGKYPNNNKQKASIKQLAVEQPEQEEGEEGLPLRTTAFVLGVVGVAVVAAINVIKFKKSPRSEYVAFENEKAYGSV